MGIFNSGKSGSWNLRVAAGFPPTATAKTVGGFEPQGKSEKKLKTC